MYRINNLLFKKQRYIPRKIFLYNGKSYYFNFYNIENKDNFMKIMSEKIKVDKRMFPLIKRMNQKVVIIKIIIVYKKMILMKKKLKKKKIKKNLKIIAERMNLMKKKMKRKNIKKKVKIVIMRN